ncbi:phage tail domain-containing protein [Niallia sp. Krafla_26]|uniref:phage tail domain-containing protein n=1 Tax=Niallia sp. Krafla_26 TaxID=3064703 RepID=UPI003D166A7B
MFLVYDKNMNLISYPDGAKPLDIFIHSIRKKRNQEEIEGRNGIIDHGFTYDTRLIETKMLLKSYDAKDYELLRDEIYNLLDDIYYISEEREKGKRFKVTTSESIIPEKFTKRVSTILVNFNTAEIPFAESIGTAKDIDLRGINAEDELWGFGMGLIDDPDSHKYTHTGTSFKIYNAGNESIHPFEQELKITISNIQGSTNFFELRNLTNNTVFHVNEAVSSDKKIVINGPNVTQNDLAFLRKTTKEFIELNKKWNEFKITGATSARVEFDFRFYYK